MSIETSTKCSCGGSVVLSETEGWRDHTWRARCSDCYDPTDGAGDRALVCGFGVLPEDALLAWQEAHDEALAEDALPDMVSDLARQETEERQRQRGWEKERVLAVCVSGAILTCMLYGPKRAA